MIFYLLAGALPLSSEKLDDHLLLVNIYAKFNPEISCYIILFDWNSSKDFQNQNHQHRLHGGWSSFSLSTHCWTDWVKLRLQPLTAFLLRLVYSTALKMQPMWHFLVQLLVFIKCTFTRALENGTNCLQLSSKYLIKLLLSNFSHLAVTLIETYTNPRYLVI